MSGVDQEVDVGVGRLVIGAAILAQVTRASAPWAYRGLFQRLAQQYGLDENLLHALAWQESGLNPTAVSAPNSNGTRDYGLLQINERNFASLGLTAVSALDPERNADAAARLLADLHRRGLSFFEVISAYNAGAKDRDALTPGTQIRRPDGSYVNPAYVASVLGRYLWLQLAALAPVEVSA